MKLTIFLIFAVLACTVYAGGYTETTGEGDQGQTPNSEVQTQESSTGDKTIVIQDLHSMFGRVFGFIFEYTGKLFKFVTFNWDADSINKYSQDSPPDSTTTPTTDNTNNQV